jgi:hypothetical protein
MLDCPRCHRPISTQAVTCPYCRAVLKAHGHPGITLYQATGDEYLCQTCTYDKDDTCNFPQRPYAKECTLYQDSNQPILIAKKPPSFGQVVQRWLNQRAGLLIVLSLFLISLLIALSKQ